MGVNMRFGWDRTFSESVDCHAEADFSAEASPLMDQESTALPLARYNSKF